MEIVGQCWRQVLTSQRLGHFFVDDNIDFHTPLCRGEKHSIDSILLVLRWWSAKVEFWRKPPFLVCQHVLDQVQERLLLTVQDPYRLSCLLQSTGDRPHISTAVNEPLDIIPGPLWGKATVTMLRGVVHPIATFCAIMCMAMDLAESLNSLGDFRSKTMHYTM